jgi:Ankyrin repeats (3 copies)
MMPRQAAALPPPPKNWASPTTSCRGRTALWRAADRGNGAAVRAPLGKAADARIADQQGSTPLLRAIESGEQEAAQLLLGEGAELDRRSSAGNTALMLASQEGLLEVVRAITKRGAAADLRNEQGYTALMLASAAGHGEIVKTLLEGCRSRAQEQATAVGGRQCHVRAERSGGAVAIAPAARAVRHRSAAARSWCRAPRSVPTTYC